MTKSVAGQVIVLDTTAIAALYIEGPLTSQARRLVRSASKVATPPRWRTELRNVLLKFMRHSSAPMSLETAVRTHRLAAARLALVEREPETRHVLRAAEELGLKDSYDAEFAALALELEAVVVTDDGELAERLEALERPVVLLRRLKSAGRRR